MPATDLLETLQGKGQGEPRHHAVEGSQGVCREKSKAIRTLEPATHANTQWGLRQVCDEEKAAA